MALQWTEKGSLKGPKGDRGDTGPRGAAGASMRTARSDVQPNSDVSLDQITPSANIAVDDLILDTAGQVYAVASVQEGMSVHVGQQLDVSLKGPKGDTGPAGADGKDGTGVTILGSYDDADSLGQAHPTGSPGDAYLVAGDLYVWSASESAWKNVGTNQGPQGPKGDTGAQGEKGDTGERGPAGPGITVGSGAPVQPGAAGETYIDILSGTVYQYTDQQ